jgi:hypothetical protein
MNKCCYCGQDAKSKFKEEYYCEKHRTQMRRHGRITDNDLNNEIMIYDNYAEILVKSNDKLIKILIDLDDVQKIKEFTWSISSNGYVINVVNKLLLHRYLTSCPSDKVVDHINGNRLDNRKYNLRICTQDENNLNITTLRSDNTSGVKGVGWNKKLNKWRARINYKGKEYHLGYFNTKEEAIQARIKKELELFGEFSSLNNK